MATSNVDKSLYAAPQGLAALAEETPEIEIEIEDPEGVSIEMDGMEIEIEPAGEMEEGEHGENLAETLDEQVVGSIGSTLVADIDIDKRSRNDWEELYRDGLKLLGLKYEERTQPWNGACGVHHPMITEAVVRFQSETIMETFPAGGPVETKIIGKETSEKLQAARRVKEEMNYQLTEVATEFRPEHDRMLFSLPAVGCTFKKVYKDPALGRWTSVFVPAEDVLLPYGCSDIQTAHRVTHVMRKTKNEILQMQLSGFYRDIDVGEPDRTLDEIKKAKDNETGFDSLEDEHYKIYEVQTFLNIKGLEHKDEDGNETGLALPYVVSILASTNTVLGIRRNWEEGDELHRKRHHFVQYDYIPGFGPYGFGLFHLIGGYAKSATSLLRQLVDAGTLSNLPGGLKSRGLRIKGDDSPIAPGEFRDVDVGSGTIKDNILPLPYKEPSGVLAGLLDKIIEEGRRFAATADIKISDMSANAPVGTTLALLERALKVMTAVQARTHNSLKLELKLIAGLIRDDAPQDYDYEPATGRPQAKQSDFSYTDIIPVSDPNAATLAQRVIKYQTVMQMAQMAPESYNIPLLHRQMLDVLGVKDADKIVPLPEDAKPMDPVTENMAVLTGKPVKAFLYQDHDAHLAVHMAAMQDPMIAQMMGQNPKAQMIMAAAQAHIAEHMAFKYRQQIEQQLGTTLPPEDEKLPPEIETALSGMMAKAAQQALAQNKAQAAQQQAQQQAQDPVFQLQEREMKVKEGKLALDEKRMQIDAADRADKTELDRADRQLKALLAVAKMALDERKQTATEELGEQNVRLKALHYGNMGRAQDQQLLQADRDRALEALRTLAEIHERNTLGESRPEQPAAPGGLPQPGGEQ